ncbi:MAG: DUF523 domain-containing protein [Lentisphaeria bacterium]|nr:DUF523 domain-containing protein [Lentisphaeria bacterium]
MRKKIRIGISACLLGFQYRYNGKSKMDSQIIELLRDHAELVPFCPEVECGLDIPRLPMRLETGAKGVRLIVIETGEDLTDQMREWAENRLLQMERLDLAAFIFKSGSPSCGMKCQVFNRQGKELPMAVQGIFSKMVRRKYPEMLICQETDFPEIADKLRI